MIIKKKPIKPKRRFSVLYYDDFNEGFRLSDVVQWASKRNLKHEDIFVSYHNDLLDKINSNLTDNLDYDSYCTIFTLVREPEEEYQKKFDKYKIELENYKKWQLVNEAKIKKEKEKKAKIIQEKKNKQIIRLEKELEKLKDSVDKKRVRNIVILNKKELEI